MGDIMDNEERIAALSEFLECSAEAAAQLAMKMTLKTFKHKDILVHQGDMNDQIWLILDGNAQLQAIGYEGQVTLLTAQGPGEIFGAFPNQATSNIDVKIYGHLSALQISSSDLKLLLDEYPQLGKGLSKIFGNQFHAIIERLAMHVTLTARGRVRAELLRLAGGTNNIRPKPVVAALALTAQTARETASREVNDLIRRGIIEREAKQLKIVSRTMLESMVI